MENINQESPVVQQPSQETQQQVIVPANPVSKSPKSKLSLFIITTFIFLVVIGGGGYFFVKSSNLNPPAGGQNANLPASQRGEQLKSQSTTPTLIAQISPTVVQDETVNWKTYINPSFNFKILYPPELTLQKTSSDNLVNLVTPDYEIDTKPGPNAGTMIKGGMVTISVWPPTDEEFIDRYCNSKNAINLICKATTISGHKAVEIIQNNNGKTQRKEVTIQVSRNETVSISAEITNLVNQVFFTTFDQILQTFKFTP